MCDESPVCRVAGDVIIARWPGDLDPHASARTPVARTPCGPADDEPIRLELVRFLDDRHTDPPVWPLPATMRAEGSRILPFALVDLALDRHADLLWVWSELVEWASILDELRTIGELEPMASLIRARTGAEPDDALPSGLAVRGIEALRQWSLLLPRLRIASRAGVACTYIKHSILREFRKRAENARGVGIEKLADEANRHGFLIAQANRALLPATRPYSGPVPATPSASLSAGSLALRLDERESRVEELLSALVPDEAGRLGLALDLTALVPASNGTAHVALKLARALVDLADEGDRYRISVIARPDVARFHRLAEELAVTVHLPERMPPQAIIVRPSQPFRWDDVAIPSLHGVITLFLMLDTISWDCKHIRLERFEPLWNYVFRHASGVTYISDFAKRQFESRFASAKNARNRVSLLSLDPCEYRKAPSAPSNGSPRSAVLVVGNHYDHKGLTSVLDSLAGLEDPVPVHIVGRIPEGWTRGECHASGGLSEATFGRLLDESAVVIYPSFDEGFGIPILEALAHGCKVLARDIPVFREVWNALGRPADITFFSFSDQVTTELRRALRVQDESEVAQGSSRCWRTVAEELLTQAESCLQAGDHGEVLKERFQALGSLESLLLPAQFLLSIDRANLFRESVRWILDRERKSPSPWFRVLRTGKRVLGLPPRRKT